MSVLESIKDKIVEAKSILILCHENPDGDAIGSSLALHCALKKIEKESTVYIPVPDKTYSFLPKYNEIITGENVIDASKYDLCIVLDCSDTDRLGVARPIFEAIPDSICIDHHITNQNFADISYVNAVASSTCENLIVVMASLDIALNKEIAEPLYTGLITDTGGFRYNTSQETMEFAGMLLETGVDYAKIYRRIFDVTTFAKTKLVSRALERMELFESDKIAFTYITVDDLKELNLEEADSEGIVNYGRNIDTVEVSIFAKEKEDGSYKMSLRANSYVDVSVVASKFAGGGHVRAAGCDFNMSLDSAKNALIDEIKKQLK